MARNLDKIFEVALMQKDSMERVYMIIEAATSAYKVLRGMIGCRGWIKNNYDKRSRMERLPEAMNRKNEKEGALDLIKVREVELLPQ